VLFACKTGNPEVGYLDAAVTEYHNIVGLYVTMDDAAVVGVGQGFDNLDCKMQPFPPVQQPFLVHVLFECNPVNQLHDDIF
jgi:hypothetical protein